MAKRKQSDAIADTLAGGGTPQGWQNQFSDTPQEQSQGRKRKPDGYKRKTYLMTDDLITRIAAQAEAHGVGVNEMMRYSLNLALTQLESGEHTPPVAEKVITKRTLGI